MSLHDDKPTLISDEIVNKNCLPGKQEKTCSFLVMAPGGWACAKGSVFEEMIRDRREQGTIVSMGDNCSGPPEFTPPGGELEKMNVSYIETQLRMLRREYPEATVKALVAAFVRGIDTFAWMRDGISYVGTTGMTKAEAIEEVRRTAEKIGAESGS